MNILPNGNKPAAGMINDGFENHGGNGIGRAILLTRHGLSDLPIQCLPKIVPTTDRGNETNIHIAIIFAITENGIAPIVS